MLEIHERHWERLRRFWVVVKPWLRRLVSFGIVAAIFIKMLRPVYLQWDQVKGELLHVSWLRFGVAAAMFAAFLFTFRVNSWRWILAGFGRKLPLAPTTRIWSFSELARYLPGGIWQVVGRAYLARPYGVSPSVSSASQILELTIFMLANVLVALVCLSIAGFGRIPPQFRYWVYIVWGFVPLLLAAAHPKIFYGVLNFILRRLHKQPIEQALRKRQLFMLLLWVVLGLMWQSLAVWLLVSPLLDLRIQQWPAVTGAYCFAWTLGFSIGFAAPGGMGVRELAFVIAMGVALPHGGESDPVFNALLGFLSVLLRLWAISGELIMAAAAYLTNLRAPKGDPNSPG